ncbi:ferritin-like domain-containing protein [Lebetimonas sp. JS138]|uniref:ferritin-like domain-containing protein n=1 Tax=Lebetimonas sp. JS138 TaxID=990072 RepID=UPI000466ECC6|nr:ferritin-like domain-containing protein [Lebetimonas sp. JS138]
MIDYQKLIRFSHESFIKFIYASVMVKETNAKKLFEDIAMFKYRHMVWAMADAKNDDVKFNMDFNTEEIRKIQKKYASDLLEELVNDLEENLKFYKDYNTPTINRLKNDDSYFLSQIKKLDLECIITAFNENKELSGVKLDENAKAALVFFLMEETFKEYELITIYSYLKAFSDNEVANSAFTDLAYDSIYHLRRFAQLASEMGVLTLPRPIPHGKYENIGIVEFLKENIEEEMDAEKQCLILAEKIGNEELSNFLLFISRQELYHAELLKRALNSLK